MTEALNVSNKRRRWPWLVGGAVVLLVGLAVVRRGGAGPKELDQSLIVAVKRGDLSIEVVETGKVQPREKVEVKSKVAGQVDKVLVLEGAQVKKGELLLQLDPTDYRRDVSRCEADVAQAKNALEFARLSLDRKQRGLESRGVAQADVDFALNDLKAKQVALKTTEVALGAAQDRLRYTQIVSPMDGTVIQRGIQPGEVVTPGVQATFEGKPLLTVADLSTLVVKADLNQIDVAKVKLGQTVSLTLDALPGKKYEAKVSQVAPASTTPKGKDVDVFPVEATLTSADGQIKPGMTADMRIHIETKDKVLSLPIEAVVKEAGKNMVTKVTGAAGKGRTQKAEVQTGARNDREVEVVSGLGEGEKVLIKPASSADNEYKM
jgi:HlyD family secretion protein/macrolide-specific efflux system membrane fusion protein